MLIEGEAGCEAFPFVAVDLCVFNTGFMVGKSVTFGHGIAIDAAHGVFLLAAAFTLRRASIVALFSSIPSNYCVVLAKMCIAVRCPIDAFSWIYLAALLLYVHSSHPFVQPSPITFASDRKSVV